MSSRRFALAFAAVLTTTAFPPHAADGQTAPPTIEIDAVFVDGRGNPVRDISRDEVEVWIAGYRVPLDKFMAVTPEDPERSRRSVVLLLDDITVEPALTPRVREAARHIVQQLRPGDQMAVISLSGDRSSTTDDKSVLLRSIERYTTRATAIMRPDMLGEQVLRTVAAVSRQLAESPARRRTIVGLGSGWLFDTPLPPAMSGLDLRPDWVDAMRAMASANVTLYVIDPGGVGRSRLPSGDSGFARETGGLAFVNSNDLKAAAEQIMEEASTYYILAVADPPIFRKAPLREVDVRVKRRGVDARARRALAGLTPPPGLQDAQRVNAALVQQR